MGKTKTLTEGTPWKQILLFSIPIFWGNIFQLLYCLFSSLQNSCKISISHLFTDIFYFGQLLKIGFHQPGRSRKLLARLREAVSPIYRIPKAFNKAGKPAVFDFSIPAIKLSTDFSCIR